MRHSGDDCFYPPLDNFVRTEEEVLLHSNHKHKIKFSFFDETKSANANKMHQHCVKDPCFEVINGMSSVSSYNPHQYMYYSRARKKNGTIQCDEDEQYMMWF